MRINEIIEKIRKEFEADLKQATSVKEVEALKIKILGKKGALALLMPLLKEASSEEKPILGKEINDLKDLVSTRLESVLTLLENAELEKHLSMEKVDVTLPGRRRPMGRRHVVLKMLDEALDIFKGMGFEVQIGPDIESDYYNFEALNFSKDHPARDMQDTFYLSSDFLLRTHTSNTQVRVMEKGKPPIRVVAPGKCYRNEDISARSHVIFHQIEGFYIDKGVSFADLLGTLEEFFSKFFGKEVEMRFRPSYFPFVEPGVEVDVGCIVCGGSGCSLCKHSGWLEVCGAGMIHPEVMKNGGIDPEEYSGYAWGFGIERLAMLRYGIDDIRYFFENRLSFLQQF